MTQKYNTNQQITIENTKNKVSITFSNEDTTPEIVMALLNAARILGYYIGDEDIEEVMKVFE